LRADQSWAPNLVPLKLDAATTLGFLFYFLKLMTEFLYSMNNCPPPPSKRKRKSGDCCLQ